MPFYALQFFPINCVMPIVLYNSQVQRDELATGLSFGDTVEFLKAVVFVLRETLVQLDDV